MCYVKSPWIIEHRKGYWRFDIWVETPWKATASACKPLHSNQSNGVAGLYYDRPGCSSPCVSFVPTVKLSSKISFYLEASSTCGLSNGRHCCCVKCLPFMYMILHKFLSSSLLPMHKVGSLSTFPSYRGPVLLKYRVMITSTKCMLIVNVNQLFIVVIPGNGLGEGVVSGLIKILA